MKAKNQVRIFNTVSVVCGFYTVLFSILKLARVIDWSWWVVFAPLLFVVVLTVIIAVYVNIVLRDDA